jgi:NRAMP (natural resistance-associated macrophage protein)-like metal ion transporter
MITKTKNLYGKFIILLGIIGPGLITANIDNDAGGIATYSLAGAKTGYRLLWVMLPITIALIMVQEMSARMGIVSGKGLADLIRERFGLKVTFYSLIFLIFADLGNTMSEFAGIASAGEIFGVSKYISVPISAFLVWLLVVKGNYKIVERIFLAGCLVYFSYIISGVIMDPPWKEIIEAALIPDISKVLPSDMPIIVGLLGTTITPWMQFYIQSAIVEKGIKPENLFHSKIDIFFGCIFMLIVSMFIVICCATTLHSAGITIHDAKGAALSLEPLAGKYASVLFGVGLFNASFFAAALLPLATSYYVCEGMGWESGVDKDFDEAPQFFNLFSGLIIVGAGTILIPGIDLFNILILSQIINGILIPVILLYIVKLCNDPDIMGEYTNSNRYNLISYAIIFAMVFVNLAMFYFEVVG